MACTELCWTPTECSHGVEMPPKGRSYSTEWYAHFASCEEDYDWSNSRHLWDEHDSTRVYHDPEGWRLHEDNCEECRRD